MKDSDWREINEYFAQIFSKKGIYMCVKREVAAMIKECNHIKTLPMLYVEFLYALSKDEKWKLIKEKIFCKIRYRICADCIPHRNIYQWKKQHLQHYLLRGVFLSLIINTHKGRLVQNFYVSGGYLHAPLQYNKNLIIQFEG